MTFTTTNRVIDALEKGGSVDESTGGRRNRILRDSPYLHLFSEPEGKSLEGAHHRRSPRNAASALPVNPELLLLSPKDAMTPTRHAVWLRREGPDHPAGRSSVLATGCR